MTNNNNNKNIKKSKNDDRLKTTKEILAEYTKLLMTSKMTHDEIMKKIYIDSNDYDANNAVHHLRVNDKILIIKTCVHSLNLLMEALKLMKIDLSDYFKTMKKILFKDISIETLNNILKQYIYDIEINRKDILMITNNTINVFEELNCYINIMNKLCNKAFGIRFLIRNEKITLTSFWKIRYGRILPREPPKLLLEDQIEVKFLIENDDISIDNQINTSTNIQINTSTNTQINTPTNTSTNTSTNTQINTLTNTSTNTSTNKQINTSIDAHINDPNTTFYCISSKPLPKKKSAILGLPLNPITYIPQLINNNSLINKQPLINKSSLLNKSLLINKQPLINKQTLINKTPLTKKSLLFSDKSSMINKQILPNDRLITTKELVSKELVSNDSEIIITQNEYILCQKCNTSKCDSKEGKYCTRCGDVCEECNLSNILFGSNEKYCEECLPKYENCNDCNKILVKKPNKYCNKCGINCKHCRYINVSKKTTSLLCNDCDLLYLICEKCNVLYDRYLYCFDCHSCRKCNTYSESLNEDKICMNCPRYLYFK
jgi:hypothetical protein